MNIFPTGSPYCPLVLAWDNPITRRKWNLVVQSHPEPNLTCTGDSPTRGEMAELLMQGGSFQGCLLDIFMVLAAVGRGKEA